MIRSLVNWLTFSALVVLFILAVGPFPWLRRPIGAFGLCFAVAYLLLRVSGSALLHVLTRPAVVDWLIARARRTPYTDIVSPETGELYMERFWLFNPYPPESSGSRNRFPISVRLHHIVRPDQDRHLHDHPWNARTVILRGGYVEIRPISDDEHMLHTRNAGDTCRLRFGEYHRIISVQPDTWTLFITGRYRGTWGFAVDGHKVPWRVYLGLEPKS